MAWPPPTLPINRTDATPQQTTHAGDHNALSQAVNDATTVLGTNPQGGDASVTARLLRIEGYGLALSGAKFAAGVSITGGGVASLPRTSTAYDQGGYLTGGAALTKVPTQGIYAISVTVSSDTTSVGAMVNITSGVQQVIGAGYIPKGRGGRFMSANAIVAMSANEQFSVDVTNDDPVAHFYGATVTITRILVY